MPLQMPLGKWLTRVCAPAQQGNTILAMDFMELGTLWEQLTRMNKAGQPIFQWYHRWVLSALCLGLLQERLPFNGGTADLMNACFLS